MADAGTNDHVLWLSPWPHPHPLVDTPWTLSQLSSGNTGTDRAGSKGDAQVAECLDMMTCPLSTSQNQTPSVGTFCGFVSSMMVVFPIHSGDYESTIMKTENIRELVTGFLCRLTCKTMPDKDFRD